MANIEEKDCSTLSEGAGPLVSVIVPVYNVRPYIEEALDSLVAQTYGHLEFLLVDDGSNDGSGEVCDRYASRDARFRVIHQENRGLSATRNAGLDCMSGDYVAFLDPDDAFHPDMIRRLLEPILRENADIAVCRYQDVPSTKIMKHSSLQNQAGAKTDRILGHREALSELADGTLGRAVWNKLSVRVLWHDLRFPEGHVFECTDIIYRVFDRVRTCCVVDDVLVFHRIRPVPGPAGTHKADRIQVAAVVLWRAAAVRGRHCHTGALETARPEVRTCPEYPRLRPAHPGGLRAGALLSQTLWADRSRLSGRQNCIGSLSDNIKPQMLKQPRFFTDITRFNRANIKEERPMKKILATLVALALLLALPYALAEQVPDINWADAEAAAAEIPGSWYTFEDVALQFWIPDIFENLEPTEDDPAEMIGKFEVSDGSAGIYAQYLNGYDGLTIDDAVAQLEANGATEIERCTLNGLDAASFSIPDVDAGYVIFITQSGNYVQFIFTPVSDEGFASVAQLVTASIMPEDA